MMAKTVILRMAQTVTKHSLQMHCGEVVEMVFAVRGVVGKPGEGSAGWHCTKVVGVDVLHTVDIAVMVEGLLPSVLGVEGNVKGPHLRVLGAA
jgi:hypothetical protein